MKRKQMKPADGQTIKDGGELLEQCDYQSD